MKASICVLFVLFASTLGGVFLPSPKTLLPWGQGRIVNGEKVDISKIPYQISMLHFGRHNCGGSVINEKYILTAAHCFMHVSSSSEIQVRAGSTSSRKGGVIIDVEKYTIHPQFDPDTLDYDVAVMKLAYPLTFDRNIQPAKLAEEGTELATGTDVTVSGWGRLRFEGPLPEFLQKVDLKMMGHTDCYLSYVDEVELTERQMCAHAAGGGGGKDACSGDSGGPLTHDGVVVGLVSWGADCAQPQWPGVYTSVAYFRDWINENSDKQMDKSRTL